MPQPKSKVPSQITEPVKNHRSLQSSNAQRLEKVLLVAARQRRDAQHGATGPLIVEQARKKRIDTASFHRKRGLVLGTKQSSNRLLQILVQGKVAHRSWLAASIWIGLSSAGQWFPAIPGFNLSSSMVGTQA
jgi:hypothetical protein